MTLHLGQVGAWLNPLHDDDARTRFAIEAEGLGYGTVWLGLGTASVGRLELVSRVLEATSTITVATAIVNMWTNDAAEVARSYRRIAGEHPDRFLLGVGVGHPESIATYRKPLDKVAEFLEELDEGGVPRDRRVVAALGPKALRLAGERAGGTHPYLTVPAHTRQARAVLGPDRLVVPEQTVVVDADPGRARATARAFLDAPYLRLRNYVNNWLAHGFTERDVAGGGSDRLVDALVPHGPPGTVAAAVREHLSAGADHVGIQVLGPDPMSGYRALAEALPETTGVDARACAEAPFPGRPS